MYDAVTRSDKLFTGKPHWQSSPGTAVPVRQENERDHFDVVVVGAGISGALVAEALTTAGKSVLVVDRRPPVHGSTLASTAMIQHEIDVPLTKLSKQRSARVANAAWRRSARAVDDLIALTGRLKIQCQMQSKPALYLAGNEMDGQELELEVRARRKIGIDATWIGRERLREEYGIRRDAAILSNCSASANPAQLAAGLLKSVAKRGAAIVSPVDITDMAELPSGVALATSDGRVIAAEHAVFCTGYEFLPLMKSDLHHVTSTWAIATDPIENIPRWLMDTIVWEASDPYLYFRTDPIGRLVAGGEDEDASEKNASNVVLARKSKAIAKKLEKVLGLKVGRLHARWAAPFSVTKDGLPLIDRVKGCDRVFSVMGFGGNGITFSMIASQIIHAAIQGKTDPDAKLFSMR